MVEVPLVLIDLFAVVAVTFGLYLGVVALLVWWSKRRKEKRK